MSKYIKQKNNQTNKQVKPKLKILAQTNGEDFYLNEYDLAQMVSNLNVQITQLAQTVQGIIDAMNAATQGVATNTTVQSNAPIQQELKLPKLNKVETSTLDSGKKFYGYGSDKPNIIE